MENYDYRDGIAALDASLESRRELELEWLEDALAPPLTPKNHKCDLVTNNNRIEDRDKIKIVVNETKQEDKKPAGKSNFITNKPRREWEEV